MPLIGRGQPTCDLLANLVPADAVLSSVVTVSTTPVALTTGVPGRCQLRFTPAGTIWVGNNSVTSTTGYACLPNVEKEFRVAGAQLFAVSAGVVTVGVLELS